MTTAITVPFHGAELYVVEHGGQPYTPMKPIVDGMGLDWKTQHRKISQGDGHNDHTLKRWGITEMVIPSAGGNQTMVCMPLRKLPGWLMTIHPNKVKADRREAIIRFQNECDDVLWDYWTKGQPAKPQNALKDLRSRKALPGGLTLEQQDTIKEMVKARIEALPAERRGPGAIKLWSSLKTRFGCTYKLIPPEQIVDAVSLVARVDLEGESLPALAAPAVTGSAHRAGSAARGRERIDDLRLWANRSLPDPVRVPFLSALGDIERSLSTGWTDVDEASLHIWTGLAMLDRWKTRS